jgi:hypothetical protein
MPKQIIPILGLDADGTEFRIYLRVCDGDETWKKLKKHGSTFLVMQCPEFWHKKTFKIICQPDSIKRHEWDEVVLGQILEFVVKLDGILDVQCSQFWECLEAFIQDMHNRWIRNEGAGVVPALEDLPMNLLDLPKAYKDVLR